VTRGAPVATAARATGVALVAVSATGFGTRAIFARVAYDAGGDPLSVLFLRLALAAVVMAAVMVARGEPWPRGGTLAALVALGGLGHVGESLAYFVALEYASAGLVALLLYLYHRPLRLRAGRWSRTLPAMSATRAAATRSLPDRAIARLASIIRPLP
jgi:uncharacterized membrane protein